MADSFTTNYNFIIQQPGTNRSVWGGKLNANWASIDGLLFTATTNAANALALGTEALPKAGGTTTGDIILANVGPTSTLSVGFRGAPIVNFASSKTLALTDAGSTQRATGAAALILTIPPVGTVGFPVDTVIPVRNASTATLTIARGSGVELRIAGSATNKNCVMVAQGLGALLHEAPNVWVLSGVGAS